MFTKNYHKLLGCFLGYCSQNDTIRTLSGNKVTSGITTSNAQYIIPLYDNMSRFWKSGDYRGILFGNGDTPVTIEDYTLSGNIIDANSFTAQANRTVVFDDNGVSITAVYTITNTSGEDILFKEIGMVAGPTGSELALIERTLLDSPVTIASGGIGKITYTIRMHYPV
jgi:hypothetical protein